MMGETMKKCKSILEANGAAREAAGYDDPDLVKHLLDALKAAKKHGYNVHIIHRLDETDRLVVMMPDHIEFLSIDVRAGMEKMHPDALYDQQQNEEEKQVCLRIV
jgi:hypothetical protein